MAIDEREKEQMDQGRELVREAMTTAFERVIRHAMANAPPDTLLLVERRRLEQLEKTSGEVVDVLTSLIAVQNKLTAAFDRVQGVLAEEMHRVLDAQRQQLASTLSLNSALERVLGIDSTTH